MDQQQHIIKRQVIELRIPGSLNTVAIQNRIARLYHKKVVPILNELLSKHSSPATDIKIERLELDLGPVALHQLEHALPEKIKAALALQLPEVLRQAAALPKEGRSGADADLVGYYLERGLLPWWAAASTYQVLEKAFTNVLRGEGARARRLLDPLFQQDLVLNRFLYTFPDRIRKAVLALYMPGAAGVSKKLESGLFTLFGDKAGARSFRHLYWRCLLAACARQGGDAGNYLLPTALALFAALGHPGGRDADLFQWGQDYLQLLVKLKETRVTPPGSYPELEQAEKLLKELLPLPAAGNKRTTTGEGPAPATPRQLLRQLRVIRRSFQGLVASLSGSREPGTRVGATGPGEGKAFDSFSDTDKLYIENAGLVLLWPFLSLFFIHLGLVDDKQFTDPGAAEEACLILQYLTAGSRKAVFEGQLALNKVMCGIDPYQPVDTRLLLPADKKKAARHFLRAVVRHGPLWKKLSTGGFRQAFLQREGALSIRDGNWLLQVKRETYDVILDKLPWPVQVVKLPWMRDLIFVEWQQPGYPGK